jgi:hypothetical protein
MAEERISPDFYNKKGEKVAGLPDIPVEFATRYIEFNKLRYEKQKDGSYMEIGKAEGIKGDKE